MFFGKKAETPEVSTQDPPVPSFAVIVHLKSKHDNNQWWWKWRGEGADEIAKKFWSGIVERINVTKDTDFVMISEAFTVRRELISLVELKENA